MSKTEIKARVEIRASVFVKMLERVRRAMGDNGEMRYYLRGILLEIGPKCIRVAGCDGHRLGVSKYKLGTPVPKGHRIHAIIDSKNKGITNLIREMKSCKDKLIAIELMEAVVHPSRPKVWNAELCTIDGRDVDLIDGRYPDIDQVIPSMTEREYKWGFDAKEALAAVRPLSKPRKIKKGGNGWLGLELGLGPQKVKARAKVVGSVPPQNEGEERIKFDEELEWSRKYSEYQEYPRTLLIDINYFTEVLASMPKGEMLMCVDKNSKDLNSVLFRPDKNDEVENTWVVMPRRA